MPHPEPDPETYDEDLDRDLQELRRKGFDDETLSVHGPFCADDCSCQDAEWCAGCHQIALMCSCERD